MTNRRASSSGWSLFGTSEPVTLILPPDIPNSSPDAQHLRMLRKLIDRERAEFEIELGASVNISEDYASGGPRFLIGPSYLNPVFEHEGLPPVDVQTVWFNPARRLLVLDAADLNGVTEGLSLLRTLTASGVPHVAASECSDIDRCIQRVREEIAWTYPSFGLRSINWQDVCSQHEDLVRVSSETLAALQRWIAELDDMHTWIHPVPPHGLLPYIVHVSAARAAFVRVPEWTTAFEAGIRPGDQIVDVNCVDILSRTGAPSHMKPFLAGRRLLSGPGGQPRTFEVRKPDGTQVSFTDVPSFTPWNEPATWDKLPSGTGYLRLHGFPSGINNTVSAAFSDLADCDRLIVDLRSNTGGSLTEALDFRDRFLRQPMVMGSIQFSRPVGSLSEHIPIHAEPSDPQHRWDGDVRFLTDEMTASASEDALLGLQGLSHVRLVGSRTAGGSGRPRSIRLLPGMRLSVSTALTFDRTGRCLEGNGMLPDTPGPSLSHGDDSALIHLADSA